ncbi:MAG: branched-chain amino acid ABC transporter permease [Deltaproteobacteria bacterium]|nr:MAG: branched-chain amino acid ABC transporter permease [Deltaproteobacteria bacterium]
MKPPPLLTARRLLMWGGYLALILLAPLLSRSGYWLSLLSQVAIMTVFALSFNMLLGQTGLLSFGHAVYYGLGAMITMHALIAVNQQVVPIPVTLLPLVGGLGGLVFGVLLGYVTTRRAGTTFAMISLGIGEMVAASSLMFPAFSGGEGGLSSNRVIGKGWFGITYGPQIQIYYLIALWGFACVVAMYALAHTPLGRIANAVRDNPERAEFIGYNPQVVRFLMVVLAGFFAGVAGGLTALNYEIVTSESLHAYTSGLVIMMAFVGGVGYFFGPILGALLITVLQMAVSSLTAAWLFYFGLLFLVVVLYAPGGVASVVVEHRRLWHAGVLGRLAPAYLLAALPVLLVGAGVVAVVETVYRLMKEDSARLRVLGFTLDASRGLFWVAVVAAIALGMLLLRKVARTVSDERHRAYATLRQERT